jgi:type IV pilus assembly protein PilC
LRLLSEDAAVMCDGFLLRLPLAGKLFNKHLLAQLTQLFAAMLASGVAMMDALELLPRLTSNKAAARQLQAVRQQVGAGHALSLAFTKNMPIPPYVVRLLKVGEDGGRMADILRHISLVYQEEMRVELEGLLKIISLFITCTVGLVLVSMVVGVMVPLYQGISTMDGMVGAG